MTRFRILVLGLLLTAFPASAQAAMRFVDDNSPNNPGTGTAADPYRTFDSAYYAAANGDEIRVAQGTYYENNFPIYKALTIRGGYPGYGQAGTWATANQNATAYPTIFRPSANYNGVFYVYASNVWLDGFQFYSIYCCNYLLQASGISGLKLTNNRFEGLSNTYNYGVYLSSVANMLVQNNTFITNSGSYYLLQVYNSSGEFSNNVFHSYYYYGVYFQYSPGLNVHHNDFFAYGGYWRTNVYLCGVTFQNNLVSGVGSSGYGVQIGDCGSSNPNTIVSNNFTGFYYPFYISDPRAQFIGNLVWSSSTYGYVDLANSAPRYPYLDGQSTGGLMIDGNCWQGAPAGLPTGTPAPTPGPYLVTSYSGAERWFESQAQAEAILGVTFTQNTQAFTNSILGAVPGDPHGQGCGGIGINGTPSVPPKTALTAYVGASNRDLPELDVGVNVTFTLDASKSTGYPLPLTWYTFSQVSGPATLTLTPTGNPAKFNTSAPVTGTYVLSAVLRMSAPTVVTGNTATVTVYVHNKTFKLLAPNGTQKAVFTNLQDALNQAQEGDTVQLPAGRFSAGADYAGSVTVYGKKNVTIRGAGKGVNGSLFMHDCSEALDIEYSRGVVVRDVAFEQMTRDCYNAAVFVDQSDGILIDSIRVDNRRVDPFNSRGVEFDYANGTVSNSDFEYVETGVDAGSCGIVTITGNRFTAYSEEGVYVALDCGYDRAFVTNNVFDGKFAGWSAIDIDELYGLTAQSRVAGNTIRNSGGNGIYLEDVAYSSYPILVEGNVMSNDRAWLYQDGYGVEIYWAMALIRQNTIWGFEYSGVYIDDYDEIEVGVEGNVIAYMGEGFGIENYNDTCDNYGDNCVPLTWARGNLVYNAGMGDYYHVRLLDEGYSADPGFVNGDAGNFTLTAASPLDELGLGAGRAPMLPGPTGLVGEALPGAVRLIFDEVPGAAGYTVYWGEKTGEYPQSRDLGIERTVTIDKLGEKVYFFVVKARNAGGEGFASAMVAVQPLGTMGLSVVTVDGVEPGRITQGSSKEIVVVGSGFVEGLKVYAGSTTMVVVKIEPNAVTVTAPKELKAGIYPIAVVNPDLSRGTLGDALVVVTPSLDDASGGCSARRADAVGAAMWLLPVFWLAARRKKRLAD